MKARQEFTDRELNKAFKSFYRGFLTEEEMDAIIDGKDMWMGSDEILERWKTKVQESKAKRRTTSTAKTEAKEA